MELSEVSFRVDLIGRVYVRRAVNLKGAVVTSLIAGLLDSNSPGSTQEKF
jgi:hypothetical protein